jgi:anti-sigma regulatory factor (Ser/Thr protein kinase)
MTLALAVPDESYVSAVRREVERTGKGIGLGESDRSRASLIVTELATNLVRHGTGGTLLVETPQAAGSIGLELIAIDQGPGIADAARSMRDGVSTYSSSGTGLGAIRRQSDEFDLHSSAGLGTAVLSRIWPQRRRGANRGAGHGSISVAKPGEPVCGDSRGVLEAGDGVAAMVADGLGHGAAANLAAEEARRLFSVGFPASAAAAVEKIHAGLRATRGAAVGVVVLDLAASRATFCGVGNIAGLVVAGGNLRRFVSMNGIAGHAVRRIQEFVYPCEGPGLLVVLHSDGLSSNWTLDRYPGLAAHHPSLIAAVLYRDAGRKRDDATVLVIKRPT